MLDTGNEAEKALKAKFKLNYKDVIANLDEWTPETALKMKLEKEKLAAELEAAALVEEQKKKDEEDAKAKEDAEQAAASNDKKRKKAEDGMYGCVDVVFNL
jgi:hypothetical protein